MKAKTDELELERRKVYKYTQKDLLTEGNSNSKNRYHSIIKNYKSSERQEQFDLKQLFPGLDAKDASEELSLFFNKISREFQPLEPQDVPTSYSKAHPRLDTYQVAGRIRSFKKPKSIVRTDVFPVRERCLAGHIIRRFPEIVGGDTPIWGQCPSSEQGKEP